MHTSTATYFGHNQVLITITQTEKHTEVEAFRSQLSFKIHNLTVKLLFHERHCRSLLPFPPPPVSTQQRGTKPPLAAAGKRWSLRLA
jgi:hypothetical protein